MTITVSIDHMDYEIECFREIAAFESFADYSLRVLLPVFEQTTSLTTFRCSISGFPIGHIDSIELSDTILHAVASLKLNRFNDILNPPTIQAVHDAVEDLADHIATRMYLLARPGPSLSFKKDRTSESKISEPRQLAILLNQLLWDGGMFREKSVSLEDNIERIRRSAKVADQIITNWNIDESLRPLYTALIELDAKYSIRTLNLFRRERDELMALRDSESITADDLYKFVTQLVIARDSREIEVVAEPHRWTQEVYRSTAFTMFPRPEHSNLLPQLTKKEEEKRVRTQTPEGKAAEVAKKTETNRYAAAFASIFGGPKNG